MIYLDNSATTKMDDRVLNKVLPYLVESYGNPGSRHEAGMRAHEAIEEARENVANFANAPPKNVVFTSGGSEANSLMFFGIKEHLLRIGKTNLYISPVEHDSVIRAANALVEEDDRFSLIEIPLLTETGVVDTEALERLLRKDKKCGLVSVMYVNNETGEINPVSQIGRLCKKYCVLFHTDCVQAAGALPIDVAEIGCDFLSISGHKIHGGKGSGALIGDISLLKPIIHGGLTQEWGIRGGTENVPGIVGIGEACRIIAGSINAEMAYVFQLKELFLRKLTEYLDACGMRNILHVNFQKQPTCSKILSLGFDGVDAETLLIFLDEYGVCASAGSACRSREQEPSRTLLKAGLSEEESRSTVRISFSRFNTEKEICKAAETFSWAVSRLLSFSLGKE